MGVEAVSPGELLKEGFLDPLGISQYRLAKRIGVTAQRIGQIVLGRKHDFSDALYGGLIDRLYPLSPMSCKK